MRVPREAPYWAKPRGNPDADSVALGELRLAHMFYPDKVSADVVMERAKKFYETFYGVLLDGKERGAYGQRELARKIAYIPQNHTPTFPFRVLDVVMMGRTAHMRYFGSPREREAELALHHLHFLGIAHLAEQPYTNISGGERQLVLLAAALTQQPELLILDEPTAHLDFGNAHRFLHLVLRLHAQGIGILMTTHFPDHALYLSAETLVLKDKTLWKHGAAAEVIDEAGMSALYGLPVHIAQIGTRTVCVGGDIA